MILIDFNQTLIASLMAQIGSNQHQEISEDLIRHMVLATILSYKRKFGRDYGTLVLCSDDRKYWRKDVFRYYKANRKKYRDASKYDWSLIFNTLNKIRDEVREVFPYVVIQVEGAEADDVIAVLAKYSQTNDLRTIGLEEEPRPVLIVSGDKDFLQLQKYPNVKQFSPMKKRFISTDDPAKYLREHIIRGDSGDGVPNFLSDDKVLITEGKKQKSIYKDKLKKWIEAEKPEDFCDEQMLKNYRRNEKLIDLDNVPEEIEKHVIMVYKHGPKGHKKNLFNYFIKNRLKNLMEDISDF